MSDPIPVRVRDCACPDTPHPDGDIVYLRPTLSLEGGIAAQFDLRASNGDAAELTRRWLVTFVRYGAVAWSLDRPFSVDDLLADFALAMPVAEAANDLYAEALLRPLAAGRPKTSPSGPTVGSTSRTRRSTPKRRG